jgi:hypothetical protein
MRSESVSAVESDQVRKALVKSQLFHVSGGETGWDYRTPTAWRGNDSMGCADGAVAQVFDCVNRPLLAAWRPTAGEYVKFCFAPVSSRLVNLR